MPDIEWVRVKEKGTGDHWTVSKQEAETNPDAYVVLKQDAVNANGDPLPAETPESTSSGAGSSGSGNSGQKADPKKES